MALLNIMNEISVEIDNRKYSIGIFLDVSKAFDTIDHNIVLKKLEIYNIRGTALKWFSSYLSCRTQFVSIGDGFLNPSHIKCSVRQGAVLGPLLFIIYINDINKSSNLLKFILYADDTNLFAVHENHEILINQINCELIKVSEWLTNNKLSLNVKKTHFIIFHNRQKKIVRKLNIDKTQIDQVRSTKFL